MSSKIEDPVNIIYGKQKPYKEMKGDLVVGAFGINSSIIDKVVDLNFKLASCKTPLIILVGGFEIKFPKFSFKREKFTGQHPGIRRARAPSN